MALTASLAAACDDDGGNPTDDMIGDLTADGDTTLVPDSTSRPDATADDMDEDSTDTTDTDEDTADTDTSDPCEGLVLCDSEGSACVDGALVTCAPDANGCLVETAEDCTASTGGYCDDSGEPALCAVDPCAGLPLCDTEGTTCDGNTQVTCSVNTDGCLVEMRTNCTATAGGFCDTQSGTCSVDPCTAISNCSTLGTRCVGNTLQSCVEQDGCMVLEPPVNCAAFPGGYCDAASPAQCRQRETFCADGVDDDQDGDIDCDDSDCAADPACQITCGNGTIDAGEQCDDGNTTDGDGCSAQCLREGESCAAPLVVDTFPFAITGSTWSGISDDLVLDADSCTERTTGQGELVFQVDLLARETVHLSEHGGIDVVLSILPATCDGTTACAASADLSLNESAGITYVAPHDQSVFLVVESWTASTTSAYDIRINRIPPEICNNGVDDNGNGLIDCDDPNCFGQPGCDVELACSDGLDNDADGLIDCGDSDCQGIGNCICGDGIRVAGEQCDDGNTIPGDGCSANCQFENSSCSEPILVTGPSFRHQGTNWELAAQNDQVFAGAGCGTQTGAQRELVFRVDLEPGQAVLFSEHGSLDSVLKIIEGSVCDDTAACVQSSDSAEATGLTYVAGTTPQTVYLIAEAWSAATTLGFDIRIEVITPVCGDGVIQLGEQCDDGNLTSGDGCSATCQFENSSCTAPIVVTGPSYRHQGTNWSLAAQHDVVMSGSQCVQGTGTGDKRELVFQVEVQPGQAVHLSEHGALDSVLSLMTGSCASGNACVASSDLSTNESAGISWLNNTGSPVTVFAVVEAWAVTVSSGFDIRIELTTPSCGNGIIEPGEHCDGSDGCDAVTCTYRGEACADAPLVSGSFRLQGAAWSGVVTDDVTIAGAGCLTTGKQELVFRVDLEPSDIVRFREVTSFNAIMHIIPQATCGTLGSTACTVSNDTGEDISYQAPAGSGETVYLVFESASLTESNPFDLHIDVRSPVCGDGVLEGRDEQCDDGNTVSGDGCSATCQFENSSCTAPIVVTGPSYRYQGTNWELAAQNDHVFSGTGCGSQTGNQRELVFQVDLQPGQTVQFSEHGALDSVLKVITNGVCDDATACFTAQDLGTNESGGVTYSNNGTSSQTVFLVAEAWSASTTSAFDIRIVIRDPEICGDGLDNDQDGLIDCDDSSCFGAANGCGFEANCVDGLDNDANGQTDCADAICAGTHACTPKRGLHEDFLSSETFDLVNHTLFFVPDGNSYVTSVIPTTAFLTAPGTGTLTRSLTLSDDSAQAYALTLAGGVPFFDGFYQSIYVGSNGFITFGRGDTGIDTTLGDFYAFPRIAGLDDDLNPNSGANGSVIVDEFSNRVAVTFTDVPVYNTSNRNTFQMTIHTSGMIELTWLLVEGSAQRFVGISSGGTGTTYPAEVNFRP